MGEPAVGQAIDDPGARGRLVVRDRAVEHLAVAAAAGTDGVRHARRGLGRLTARDLPRADALAAGDRVHATVEVAVAWGRPLAATAEAVAHRVTDALTTMSGLVVDGIDVHVAVVVPPGDDAGQARRLS